ncbi:metallophosphoesterase [Pyxidicoccus sp. MSG2]|uniref:metallophosphoesterase n=1 Tax=Pyxidicoccus sp. MSG2 TaxID=2996790 RepID=UPI00227107F5|nr:metallophosphoesterase [Pyxidicoccus sp. MSG2]MCY1019082.1 metallophosphoesterase [Pyxidicoccus sp. MSG2]
MTQRLVVISDLHLTPPGDFGAFRSGGSLAAFVRHNARANTTLVLNGDVFDLLHVPGRPSTLSLKSAPALIQAVVNGIGATDWGRALYLGLRGLMECGGRCVIIPGNHDPELHHPDTRSILLGALGLPETARLELHHAASPWAIQVGQWEVRVGHGHRSDTWNDVPPEELQKALQQAGELPLPPGSRLVLEVLRPFRRNETTGTLQFSFIDLLKPELAVPLLLLYLEPKRALSLLPGAMGVGRDALLRAFRRQLLPSPTLAYQSGSAGRTSGSAPPSLADALARAIASEVGNDLRASPDVATRALQAWLAGQAPPVKGTLAFHGGAERWLVRAALRHISEDGSFFDPSGLGATDREVLREHLPEGSGPRVVICGHTHAAREHRPEAHRVYINTGTWMDLMQLPELAKDEEVSAWIDSLEQDRVNRLSRTTYAEVTEAGAFLRTWTPPAATTLGP